MYYLNVIIMIAFSMGLIISSNFTKKYGFVTVLMGNFLLMIIGIVIISSGFEMLVGEHIITEVAGETVITKTITNVGWFDTVLGTMALLFGLGGMVTNWREEKASKNPYRDD